MMCGNGKGCSGAKVSKLLLVVGGLNWGVYGLGYFVNGGWDWNLVQMLLGSWPAVEAAVYVLVGLSAVGMMMGCRCKTCSVDSK